VTGITGAAFSATTTGAIGAGISGWTAGPTWAGATDPALIAAAISNAERSETNILSVIVR
jgi:hypothetical protein